MDAVYAVVALDYKNSKRNGPAMRRDIPALTMIRFIAALGVVWHHFGLPKLAPDSAWHDLASTGYTGVTLFFILSGFILFYVSDGADLDRRPERRDFWRRRIARIYPVYFFAWALTGALMALDYITHDKSLVYLAKSSVFFGGLSLTLLQGWVPHAPFEWNLPGWTLCVEAFFYASFPLIFMRVRHLSQQGFVVLLVLSCLAQGVIIWAVQLADRPLLAGTILATTWTEYLQQLPILRMPQFIAGMALGGIYLRGTAVSRPGLWLVPCSAVLLLTLASPATIANVPRDALLMPEFCVMLYLLALVKGPSSGVLASPAILLGKASYAMYILQAPLFDLYLVALGREWHEPRSWADIGLFCVLLIGSSVLAHLYIERPAERWIRTARRQPATSPAIAVPP